MRLRALVAVMGLLGACAAQSEVDNNTPRVEQVQAAGFTTAHALQFKVVDEGSTVMKELFQSITPGSIGAEIDRWTVDGKTFTDYYLSGPSPAALRTYLADKRIPPDRELAFEKLGPDRWRTLLLIPTTELDDTSIARAEVSQDANIEHPLVTLDLTPAGARTFGDLTARIAGHKLAVLVDGTVTSAPVIIDAIRGGRAQITFGDDAQL